MSVSLNESQIRQREKALQRHLNRHTQAIRKMARLEADIAGLIRQATSTRSESSRGSYLSRAEGKQRELQRARDEEVRATQEITSAQDKLTKAQRKLAEAQSAESGRRTQKEAREHRQREQRERWEQQRQKWAQRSAERQRARQEKAHDRDLELLHHRTTELERQLAEAERRAAPEEITVLFLASSPGDQPALRLDKETREIQKQFRAAEYRDSIWFEWRLARRLTDLIQDLNEVQPDILHFSGHGSRVELAFEDADGRTIPLDNEQLEALLEAAGGHIRLAVFNSCESATQAKLACNHIDVAIGMESGIGDEAAKTFAAQFYNSLGFGLSVGDAFRQATLQLELAHGKTESVPKLFTAASIDPETVVLVNSDTEHGPS